MIDFNILLKMFGAIIVTLPIAYNRERAQRAAGLRTFPIVAVTSCGFLLTGDVCLEESASNARLMQGLIGGLGFLGGGAILKNGDSVRGLATAASIWAAGAIGMAVAFDRWEIAIALSVTNFLALTVGGSMKEVVSGDQDGDLPACD